MSEQVEPARLPVSCLIVDDLAENLLALSEVLRQDGVEIVTAHSGDEALERLLTHDIALALIDVQMPGMDGFQLAELMRSNSRTRDVPIIFVTAGVQDRTRMFKGYDAGAVDYLYKPVEPAVLRNKAAVFFELHRHRARLARELSERTETLRLHELFTAVLGHDLRSPLSAILMAAETIQRRSGDADAKRRADGIVHSARSMSRLIGDMLDLARARLGTGITLNRRTMGLDEVLAPALAEIRARYAHADVAATQRGWLLGEWDGDRIAQVIANLLGNAIQHGAAEGTVTVELDGTDSGSVRLRVENAGAIPLAQRASLFDPFRTSRSGGGAQGGLGLGLFIAREIVLAHGGTIAVDHLPGDRTRFDVVLPRGPAAAVPEPASATSGLP
ncbi:MAG: hybrid sensor histidine kinase/response regulator [Proteobacteria bacterium]|nr:hybrid sensor histidine kinase/response regulator [Pseudomonadota bacterium]